MYTPKPMIVQHSSNLNLPIFDGAPFICSWICRQRLRVSPFLVFFTFGIIDVCSRAVSTDVQSHPRLDEPPGTGYFGSKGRVLSAEDPDLDVEALEDEDEGNERNAIQEDEQVTTQRDRSGEDDKRRHVNLVIAVPSVRPERREAIRKTWLKWGDDRVVLRFFTERPNEANHGKRQESSTLLTKESLRHGDITIQDIGTGMNFGVKLLEAMRWMSHHYSFDFFLRLDDDYFLCLERMLNELSCLLKSGAQQSPFYAGSRACAQPMPYIDEAYILVSSVIVDRILAAPDLNCTATGSLTSAAWVTIGGPGNPQGDVAWVRDRRLDYHGLWWKENHTSPVCEQKMGIHCTYPDQMKEYWGEISSKASVSQSTAAGCEDLFRYEDDGKCPATLRGVDDELLLERLKRDNLQPCDSFKPGSSKVWCGKQGC